MIVKLKIPGGNSIAVNSDQVIMIGPSKTNGRTIITLTGQLPNKNQLTIEVEGSLDEVMNALNS